jgi:uncharacterized repeat protein (TIGR02543 family)
LIKRLISIALALVVCVALGLGMTAGVAASDGVGMVIVPTPKTATVSQDFTVDIKVTNSGGAEVNSAGAHLNFSTTYLEVVSITPGSALGSVLKNAHDNTAGTIDYDAGVPVGNPPVTTEFVLATVTFHAKAVTAGTALTFVFAPVLRQTAVYVGLNNVLTSGDVTNGNVIVTTATYALTMAASPMGYGTATDQTGGSPYAAGTPVSIKAVANTGYEFVSWTASAGTFANAAATETTFTMPAQPVTVTANFKLSGAVGGTAYPPNKLLMVLPWIFLGAAIIVGATLLVRRRRSAVK